MIENVTELPAKESAGLTTLLDAWLFSNGP
jgi:hypothetical protein